MNIFCRFSFHALVVCGLVFSAVPPSTVNAGNRPGIPTDLTYTFTGSPNGSTFSVKGSGSVPGFDVEGSRTSLLNEAIFGDFIIPIATTGTITGTGSLMTSFSAGGVTQSATGFSVQTSYLDFQNDVFPDSGGRNIDASGTIQGLSVAGFNIPGVLTFQQLFRLGSFVGSPGEFEITLIFISTLSPGGGGGGGGGSSPGSPPSFVVTDAGSIMSAETTGVPMGLINQQVTQNTVHAAIGDLNQRIFRSRSGMNGNGGTGNSGADTNTLNYLNFAASQNIDYRVALGLADGEEVEMVDTLAQNDTLWASSPFAMIGGPLLMGGSATSVSTKAVVAVPEGSGKGVVEDKLVMGEVPNKRFEVYTAFDYGFYDQDNLTRTMRGFETDSYAGTIGLEYQALPWLAVGTAFTQLESNTEANSNLGGIDLEGQLLSGYATAVFGQTYLDVIYTYGNLSNEIHRNTLLGRTAHGDTDSDSHNVSLNLGHALRLSDVITVTPYTGLDYATGSIDGYTERGGGNANLIYRDSEFDSMIGRLGTAVTHRSRTPLGRLTSQARVAWAHEFRPESDSVSASLQTSPFALVTGGNARRFGGYTAEGDSAHPGTDWLELGADVRLDLGDSGFNVSLGYEGQFARDNATAHFGNAKIGYEW